MNKYSATTDVLLRSSSRRRGVDSLRAGLLFVEGSLSMILSRSCDPCLNHNTTRSCPLSSSQVAAAFHAPCLAWMAAALSRAAVGPVRSSTALWVARFCPASPVWRYRTASTSLSMSHWSWSDWSARSWADDECPRDYTPSASPPFSQRVAESHGL